MHETTEYKLDKRVPVSPVCKSGFMAVNYYMLVTKY